MYLNARLPPLELPLRFNYTSVLIKQRESLLSTAEGNAKALSSIERDHRGIRLFVRLSPIPVCEFFIVIVTGLLQIE